MGSLLSPWAEKIQEADPGLLTPFYMDDVAFDISTQLLKILLDRGPEWGYLPEQDKSLFIADFLDKEEAANRDFTAKVLYLNFVAGGLSRGPGRVGYMGET